MFIILRNFFISAFVFSSLVLSPASAQVFSSKAKHAFLLDMTSGTVLYEKDPDVPMPPASMAKLMTVAVIFEALTSGELQFHDKFQVSENAWRTGGANSGGSTMFLKLDSEATIEDLLRGIIIQSGNDACITIAEGMAGNEETFAQRMNALGKKIGMKRTQFKNSTGLPHPDQFTTARDLAILSQHLISKYPDLYKYFAEEEFTWNKITQKNRNPLLPMNIGADGLKTGHTEESGYGLAASAMRDGRRVVMVLNGLESRKARREESRRIIDWGFRAFHTLPIFDSSDDIAGAKVFGGEKSRVQLRAQNGLNILLPKGSAGRLTAKVVYQGPIKAPIDEGTPVGKVVVRIDGRVVNETPVFAAESVGVGTLTQRAQDAAWELVVGLFNKI